MLLALHIKFDFLPVSTSYRFMFLGVSFLHCYRDFQTLCKSPFHLRCLLLFSSFFFGCMWRTWLMESPFQITQHSRFSVTLFDTLLIFSPFSSLNLFIFPHLVRKKACTYLARTFDIFIRWVLMCMRLWFSLVPTGTVDVCIYVTQI